jgi:hypothetical protein
LADILDRANAAAHCQRHEYLLGRPPHHIEHDISAFVTGRDIQEHQLVGAFLLIPRRHLDRVTCIAQIDEIRPLHHAPAVDIKARNHTLSEHWIRRENHAQKNAKKPPTQSKLPKQLSLSGADGMVNRRRNLSQPRSIVQHESCCFIPMCA